MRDALQFLAVVVFAAAIGIGGAIVIEEALGSPDATPTVEEADTDDLTAGRYHQRTRTNNFFRRGRG